MQLSSEVTKPKAILFDWHGTLADTNMASYNAINIVLEKLDQDNLLHDLINAPESLSSREQDWLRHIAEYHTLPEEIPAKGILSRTDLFHAIFKPDKLNVIHDMFDTAYADVAGDVCPIEVNGLKKLHRIKQHNIPLGMVTNRKREFINQELEAMDNGAWQDVFDVTIAVGDEQNGQILKRKPSSEPLEAALESLELTAGPHIWYIGDSKGDMQCARATQPSACTAIFYNRAGYSKAVLHEELKADFAINSLDEMLANLSSATA